MLGQPSLVEVEEVEVQAASSQSGEGLECGNFVPRLDTIVAHGGTEPPKPPQSSTAPTFTPGTGALDNVWNYSVPVPGSKKNKQIYPKAPFQWGPWTQEEWRARFAFVKNELERLAYKYLRLLEVENRPSYSPRMVGTCPADARPSVVVTCRDADFKALRNLFRARAEKPLCLEPELNGLRWRIPSLPRRAELKIPPLLLVYHRTATRPVARPAENGSALVSLGAPGVTCGGLIRHDGRTATLGVSLDVEGITGTLTVDHLFYPKYREDQPSPIQSQSGSEVDDEQFSSDMASTNRLWEDDDEYGDLEPYAPPEPMQVHSQVPLPTAHSTSTDSEEWETFASSPKTPFQRSAAYLDWALTCPASVAPNPAPIRVNTVFPGGYGSKGVVLKTWHESPRFDLTPVYFVSGLRGVLYGQILAAPSYIPSPSGRVSCEAWTMIPDDPNGKSQRLPPSRLH
jgi:hypothetical protein